MTIKLTGNMETYNDLKTKYINLVNANASEEEQSAAWSEMQDALVTDLTMQITNMVRQDNVDRQILSSRGQNVLTSSETKFFNEINTTVGYKEEILLPESTIDRIFEDLTTSHPLLAELNIKTTGLITRIIKSDASGAAAWGKIFGEIKGQLDSAFTEETFNQSKLTAFVVMPNDLLQYGPEWVELFVRTQIVETFAVALEKAYLIGTGLDQPIGLIKDLDQAFVPESGYKDKTAQETPLTLTDAETSIKELAGVMKYLSTKKNGKAVNVDGKVILVVNPADAWDVKAKYTFLNANGVYVTVLPFNLRIVESEFMPQGKLLAFVNSRYDAYVGGGVTIKGFDQTLAIEDCQLYTAKQFAYGKAHDNKAAALYTLQLTTVPGV